MALVMLFLYIFAFSVAAGVEDHDWSFLITIAIVLFIGAILSVM